MALNVHEVVGAAPCAVHPVASSASGSGNSFVSGSMVSGLMLALL